MRHVFFTIFTMLFTQFIFAQSVDLDKEQIKVSYVKLPEKPVLDPALRTYYIKASGSSLDINQLKKGVSIMGWTKNTSNGFYIVDLGEPKVRLFTANTIEETDLKDGKKVVTGYYPKIEYTLEFEAKVTDSTGKLIKKIPYTSRVTTFNGAKVKTRKDSDAKLSLKDPDFLKEVGGFLVRVVNAQLNNDFGYEIINKNEVLWILNSKKHPDYEGSKNAYATVKSAFDKMAYDKPTDQLRAELEPAIKYFKEMPDRYSGTDKKERKMKYSAYFNLAYIYYFLDDPEQAIMWADKLIANDYDPKDGAKIKEDAQKLGPVMKANMTNSRHMPVSTIDNLKIEIEEPSVSIKNMERYNPVVIRIKKDSQIVHGFLPKDFDEVIASANAYISLVVVKEGKEEDELFLLAAIDYVKVAEGNTYRAVFARENDKRRIVLAKELYNKGKYKVFELGESGILFQHLDEDANLFALGTWVLSYKKFYAFMAKDCPAVRKMVENKEFGVSEEKAIKFCMAMDEHCK
ncbi:MAG TPA: hypothetical protein PLC76_01510 [Saprospiraceae bacterium]|nr:hypothetical protein [Saprospiraceae bacterium]HRP83372.1 hypothetical protein [Saprospiraceae bacterium]